MKDHEEKRLSDRTVDAVVGKVADPDIWAAKRSAWSKEEEEIVLKHHGTMSVKELQRKYLHNRTISAIQWKAHDLDITSRKVLPWSENEDIIVLKRYGTMPVKELQEKYLFNKSIQAIRTRAHRLGVASKRNLTRANEEKKTNPDSANRTSALLSTTHSSTPFSDWLAQNIGLPESSIVAYTDAVDTISKEMYQKGTIQKSLEDMSPFELDLAISLNNKGYRF